MGEAPVILDTTLVTQSVDELKRFFINKGYMNAEVSASIDTSRVKKAVVTYRIVPNTPYRIHNYSMDLSDPKIDSIAKLKPPHRSVLASAFRTYSDDYTSLIKTVPCLTAMCWTRRGNALRLCFVGVVIMLSTGITCLILPIAL